MIHTVQLITPLLFDEYNTLIHRDDWRTRTIDGREYRTLETLAGVGIRNICAYDLNGNRYCELIMNLQRVVNDGKQTTELFRREKDFEKLKENFSRFIAEVLPQKTDIDVWKVKRIDYTIDLHLTPDFVDKHIILLQRGNKHQSWLVKETKQTKEDRIRQHRGRKDTPHPVGSCIFENKQYYINIYDKEYEREQKQTEQQTHGYTWITDSDIEACKGVLRLEVQVISRDKLREIQESGGIPDRLLKYYIRHDIVEKTILEAYMQIAGRFDYYSVPQLAKIIYSSDIRSKRVVLDFLTKAEDLKSVWKAEEEYKKLFEKEPSRTPLKTIRALLRKLKVNPAPIPPEMNDETIENLLDLIQNELMMERVEDT